MEAADSTEAGGAAVFMAAEAASEVVGSTAEVEDFMAVAVFVAGDMEDTEVDPEAIAEGLVVDVPTER